MRKIIEFIPNISTCDKEIIKMFVDVTNNKRNVKLLNYSSDKSHNRSVFTIIGTREGIKEIAFDFAKIAVSEIDITTHKGVHPRIGSIDVMPFVPLRNISMDELVILTKEIALDIYSKLNLPVYLYEFSQEKEYRKNLADIRNSGFENLCEKIKDNKWLPDYGKEIHKTAGATCIGARKPLVAYNINLESTDISFAKKLASEVREKNGKFKCVKALGLQIVEDHKKYVQLSMNLTDYKITSITEVFDYVSNRCQCENINIINSELIGMVPLEEVSLSLQKHLKLDCKLEDRILDSALKFDLLDDSLDSFLDKLSSNSPTPGGGSVAALVGSLGVGLMNMVTNFTVNKEKYAQYNDLISDTLSQLDIILEKMKSLVLDDIDSYNKVSIAYKLPKETDEDKKLRKSEIEIATLNALIPPYKTALLTCDAVKILENVYEKFNRNLISDFGVACELFKSTFNSAYMNFYINASFIGLDKVKVYVNKIEEMKKYIDIICPKIFNDILNIIKNSVNIL